MDTHIPSTTAQNTPTTTINPLTWLREHWVALALMTLVMGGALWIRLLTFERFLPAQDYTDEAAYYIIVTQELGFEDAAYLPPRSLLSWTPAYVYGSAAVVTLTDWLTPYEWRLPSDHIYALRLTSVILGTLTTAMIAWAAWQLGGLPAAVLSGTVWAFAPAIIDMNSLGLPDTYAYFFMALATATAIQAWHAESTGWLFASLIFGILAIFSKFPTIGAVIPFSLVTLWLLIRQPRRMAPWVAVYAVVAIAAIAYLFFIVDPLGGGTDHRELNTFQESGLALALDFSRNLTNARMAAYPIMLIPFWLGLAGGIVGYVYNRQRGGRTLPLMVLAILAVTFVLSMNMASAFTVSRINAGKIRHVLPGGMALMVIWSALVAQMIWALSLLADDLKLPERVKTVLPVIIVGGFVVGWMPDYIYHNAAFVRNYNQPYINEIFWSWTDSSLPREGRVWVEDSSALTVMWNRPWGGYDGDKPFEWWNEPVDEFTQYTPEELVERGITHVMFTNKDWENRMAGTDFKSLRDEMLLVKTLPIPKAFLWHNQLLDGITEAYMYRVRPPQNAVDVPFGENIRLTGYDLNGDTFTAGETVRLRLFWQADSTPVDDYSLFVHVYPPDSYDMVTQVDMPPLTPQRPTSAWDDPEEVYISDEIALTLPEDTPAGTYRLAIGMYSYATGARLETTDPNGFHVIPIEVE